MTQPEQEVVADLTGWTPADDWQGFINLTFQGKKLDPLHVAKLKNDILETDIKQLGKSYVNGDVEHWFQHHYIQTDKYAEDKKVGLKTTHTCETRLSKSNHKNAGCNIATCIFKIMKYSNVKIQVAILQTVF